MKTNSRDSTEVSVRHGRVLFLIDEMEAITAGGTERQLLQLVGIAQRSGLQPTICVLRGTKWLTEEVAGCPVAHFDIASIGSLSGMVSLLRLARWARMQRFLILQTFFAESNLLGPWIGKLAAVSVILTTRRNLKHSTADGMGRTATRLQWLSNLLTDEIVVNSEAVARHTAATEWVSAKRIRVVYNGIDLAALQPAPGMREQMRAQLGVGDEDILVGNISGLRAIKGVEVFAEAAAMAAKLEPRMKFVLVGEGEMRPALEAAIARHGLHGKFHLAGAAEDIRPYLAAMDIAVLCSSAEGFSNSLLEYMAVGLPAVATDVGGNSEALGEAGVLIPPDNPTALSDAILSLMDVKKRAELGAKALLRVKKFDLAYANQQMGDIFRGHAAKKS
jgi:glycosyltransferase involved in cell wall biosynthesis